MGTVSPLLYCCDKWLRPLSCCGIDVMLICTAAGIYYRFFLWHNNTPFILQRVWYHPMFLCWWRYITPFILQCVRCYPHCITMPFILQCVWCYAGDIIPLFYTAVGIIQTLSLYNAFNGNKFPHCIAYCCSDGYCPLLFGWYRHGHYIRRSVEICFHTA